MPEEKEEELVYELCLRCAEPNLEGASRCEKCGVPLDPSASTHPWEMKTANHHAYAEAVSPRRKPIIFWGVWIYFAPFAIDAIWILWDFIRFYKKDEFYFYPESKLEIFMLLALPLGYGSLSIWALWSVTTGFFKKPKQNSYPPPNNSR